MAVLNHLSDQVTTLTGRGSAYLNPQDYNGRVRSVTGYFKNTTGATIAIGQNIALVEVNPCKVLPNSRLYFAGFTAGNTLDLGINGYVNSKNEVVADALTSIAATYDVSANATFVFETGHKAGIKIPGEAILTATVRGAAIPVNAEIWINLLVVVD
jgi:hypothetical protein